MIGHRGQAGPRIGQERQPGEVAAEAVLRGEAQVGDTHRPAPIGEEERGGGGVVDEAQLVEADGARRAGVARQAQRGEHPAGDGLTGVALGGGLDLQEPLGPPGGAQGAGQVLAVVLAEEAVEAGLEGAVAVGEGVDDGEAAAAAPGGGARGGRLEEGPEVAGGGGGAAGQAGPLRAGTAREVLGGGGQHLGVAVGGVGEGEEEGEGVLADPAAAEGGDEALHEEVVEVGARHPGIGQAGQARAVGPEGLVTRRITPGER